MNQPPPPERTEPTLVERLKASPLTALLTAVNVAVFLWAESKGSTTDTATLLQMGAMEPLHVWAGEYWRLGTCMFLHIGWMHLLWNSYASFGWCAPIERFFGKRRFLLLYLASGLAGGCASSIAGLVFGGRVSAGASGAMFGIVGATLAIRRRQLGSFAAFTSDRGVRSTVVSIGIWTVIGLTALNMDNSAHFGGFVAGALVSFIFTSPAGRAQKWLAFGAAYGALVIGAARPWWTPHGGEAMRLGLYTYGWLHGELPRSKPTEKDAWALDVPRGLRLGEKGCARGLPYSCWALATYYPGRDQARADELMSRACALDSALCSPPDP